MQARILVVDDEESILYTFSSFLADEGYAVATAADPEEALARMAEASFDVIFMDILLKDCTGIDLLRQVKEKDPLCPVIMITGYPNVESASEAVRLDAFDYLVKPVRQEQLLQVTRLALQHKTLLEEKERYRSNLEAIFRSVKDAIITVNDEMTIIELNQTAMDMCGLGRDVIGKPFGSLPEGCPGTCLEVLREAFRTRQPVELKRIECQLANRPRFVVSLTTYPLLDRLGGFSGSVLVFRDETRLADLENKLVERLRFHRLVGKSPSMQRLYALIDSLASLQTTVLITGETGTGKELVAEALHHQGDRSNGPLVKVNCSALAESLLESELFGHVKGAFTGAVRDRIGRFQQAHGGTIFLDEIGDLSPKIQLLLLRVLQEREFERVGDTQTIKTDVRVIAATNRPLREMVSRGKFREDLYYRLKVVELSLPPLRERREDIPLLVHRFLKEFAVKFHKEIEGITEDVLQLFLEYSWPGNVRELEHTLEHAFIMCRDSIIRRDHLPSEFARGMPGEAYRLGALPQGEREMILQALEKTAGNKARAARLLGIDRKTLYRKMEKHGVMAATS
jgi:PAS domain S-box-containing protein